MPDLIQQSRTDEYPWGRMIWLVDGQTTANPGMSLARMEVKVGAMSERHSHANCHECIHVLDGMIVETVNEEDFELTAGMTIFIPQGTRHVTKNIGDDLAVMMISYSESIREYAPEKAL